MCSARSDCLRILYNPNFSFPRFFQINAQGKFYPTVYRSFNLIIDPLGITVSRDWVRSHFELDLNLVPYDSGVETRDEPRRNGNSQPTKEPSDEEDDDTEVNQFKFEHTNESKFKKIYIIF